MPGDVRVPSVGESVTYGVLQRWLKKRGDLVEVGEPLFELETDKVTTEVYAEERGRLIPLIAEGSRVEPGQVVARIEEWVPEEEEGGPPSPPLSEVGPEEEKKLESPAAREPTAAPVSPPSSPEVQAQLSFEPKPAHRPRVTRRKMSPLRLKLAERLVRTQAETAQLTTFAEADMSSIQAVRNRYRDQFLERYGVKLGLVPFFVRAVVRALQAIPQLNSYIEGEEIVQNHYYDIGVAVSTDRGLVVPVIRDADQLSLAELAREIHRFAEKARTGKLSLEDLEGGVFTVTNGGVFGSLLSTPLLNPPQSGILGMHAIIERPVAIEGRVEIRPMMYLALTYDHRVVDGREAIGFLKLVKEFVENPAVDLLGL
ncbi:2-oxo acid dehydrogenase subunit E2 [Candidatus Methylacidithermus pantelleriae]|uniref:Dihydrolipoamide acetyltransferase component of pyruvate dehydrogenase complex n=1 Tax=Candidatus Methylacidithermus pantelleriae TaxID=2744239 RepID=A0A8J2BTT0_9BACT|nr:2-oxo acid dehydrogenase subunit E2 [Candidatus Methylacidithermus pantelleriae]CAF0698625.1 2-oxoglutarate dehydrogenase complex (dihydrolipoyltranssuccinase, E2 subunit) [Candidatus Methylacidithermus pantelleriae]